MVNYNKLYCYFAPYFEDFLLNEMETLLSFLNCLLVGLSNSNQSFTSEIFYLQNDFILNKAQRSDYILKVIANVTKIETIN